MKHFTSKQRVLFTSYTLGEKEGQQIREFLLLLDKENIAEIIKQSSSKAFIGRPEYNPYAMFVCILFGFIIGKTCLRELEDSCKSDLRFIYIM